MCTRDAATCCSRMGMWNRQRAAGRVSLEVDFGVRVHLGVAVLAVVAVGVAVVLAGEAEAALLPAARHLEAAAAAAAAHHLPVAVVVRPAVVADPSLAVEARRAEVSKWRAPRQGAVAPVALLRLQLRRAVRPEGTVRAHHLAAGPVRAAASFRRLKTPWA